MTIKQIVKQTSEETGIPERVVREAVNSVYKFIRSKADSIPLGDVISKEDFDELRTSFNIPLLGKYGCTYDRYKRVNKAIRYKEQKEHNNNNK